MAIKINGNTVIADNQNITSTGTISATGNITSAGNIVTTGTIVGNVQTTGPVSTTGNITAGNVSATGNITASFFIGNGSQLTGIDATQIQSGTSNVKVVSSGGNVTVSVGGTPNVAIYATTGQFVTGVNSVSGNVTGGNVLTGGLISATSNITGGNILTAGQVSATGNLSCGGITINGNAVITGNLRVDGTETIFNTQSLTINDKDIVVANNVTGGANVDGAGLQAGNPGVATWFFNNATTSWQSNIGITPTTNGTLALGGASNYWGTAFLTTVSVTGNVTTGNINIGGNIVDSGALSIITGSNGNLALLPNGNGNINTGANIMPTANATANIGSASLSYNTIFAKATSAQYADLAEKYTADADYASGTVVMFGGSAEVTLCSNDACSRVAGVISTNPSYRMNDGLTSEHTAMVALTGRVPTRVTGTVRKGDMMVSAGNGVARAEANPQVGTVIGKALADSEGDAVIEVVVGRV